MCPKDYPGQAQLPSSVSGKPLGPTCSPVFLQARTVSKTKEGRALRWRSSNIEPNLHTTQRADSECAAKMEIVSDRRVQRCLGRRVRPILMFHSTIQRILYQSVSSERLWNGSPLRSANLV